MSESKQSQDVSVIGIGNMGSALAEALIANGHRVTVWNRTAAKCEALADAGASSLHRPPRPRPRRRSSLFVSSIMRPVWPCCKRTRWPAPCAAGC